jgi:CBS domain-containing protein
MKSIQEILGNRELFTINSGTKVDDAVKYMAQKGVGLLPVLSEGKLIGVFSERDLVKRVIAPGLDHKTTLVDDVMSKNLVMAKIDESTESAMAKMKDAQTRHILIIDEDRLKGVLSVRDLLEIDLSECKTTIEVLNNYIYSK